MRLLALICIAVCLANVVTGSLLQALCQSQLDICPTDVTSSIIRDARRCLRMARYMHGPGDTAYTVDELISAFGLGKDIRWQFECVVDLDYSYDEDPPSPFPLKKLATRLEASLRRDGFLFGDEDDNNTADAHFNVTGFPVINFDGYINFDSYSYMPRKDCKAHIDYHVKKGGFGTLRYSLSVTLLDTKTSLKFHGLDCAEVASSDKRIWFTRNGNHCPYGE